MRVLLVTAGRILAAIMVAALVAYAIAASGAPLPRQPDAAARCREVRLGRVQDLADRPPVAG